MRSVPADSPDPAAIRKWAVRRQSLTGFPAADIGKFEPAIPAHGDSALVYFLADAILPAWGHCQANTVTVQSLTCGCTIAILGYRLDTNR